MPIYDVIIVGAGPVGLATAIGLRQRGIKNILVLDQTKAFRRVGKGFIVLPNGLKALKCLDKQAYEEVKKAALILTQPENSPQTSTQWFKRDLRGQPIGSMSLDFNECVRKYGEGVLQISWFDLQTTLRNLIPQEQVKANHRCINVVYQPEEECVQVDCLSNMTVEDNPYAYWNSEAKKTLTQSQNTNINIEKSRQKSFRGKLVVAADGINSTIRKLLYKDTYYESFSRPEYSGYAAINCSKIDNVPNEIQNEIQGKFLKNSPKVTICQDVKSRVSACELPPRMILVSESPGQFRYIIHIPVALNQLQENSRIDLTLQHLENNNFPNAIKKLVSISDPTNIDHVTFYIHRATVSDSLSFPTTANLHTEDNSTKMQPPWHIGRVVLVGDAAHGMPNFAAQGLNQGWEDAFTIAELISKLGILDKLNDIEAIQEVFNKYENIRRPLIEYVQKITMSGLIYSTNQKELDKYKQQIYARDFEEMV